MPLLDRNLAPRILCQDVFAPVTVVLGGVAGGVAGGAKVGAKIMYIDAFSPMSLLLPLRNVLYT